MARGEVVIDLGLLIWVTGWLMCWRILAGHYAWRIHTTAKARSGIKPEPEDWLLGGIFAMVLAWAWPAVLLVKYFPQQFKSEDEQEAEKLSAQIKFDKVMLESENRIKVLEKDLEFERGKRKELGR